MKLKTMILLSGLLLVQTLAMPVSASTNVLLMQTRRKMSRVHIEQHGQPNRRRSVSLLVSGYVEDSILVLSFNIPLRTAPLRVVDSETGNVVFEGTASGTSLSIPLERDSENFEVYIN